MADLDKTNLALVIFQIIIGFMTVAGNGIVILVFCKEKQLRTVSNFYLISLACTDFIFGCVGAPFAIFRYELEIALYLNVCLAMISSIIALAAISIFGLVGISIDRYLAVVHPTSCSNKLRKKIMIISISLCWIVGSTIGFLPFFGWNKESTKVYCGLFDRLDSGFLLLFFIVCMVIPIAALITIYGLIYRVIQKIVSRRTQMIGNLCDDELEAQNDTAAVLKLREQENKATRSILLIIIFFGVCWLPVNLYMLLRFIFPAWEPARHSLKILIILAYLNSAFNPFLYAYNIQDFRKRLLKLFCC